MCIVWPSWDFETRLLTAALATRTCNTCELSKFRSPTFWLWDLGLSDTLTLVILEINIPNWIRWIGLALTYNSRSTNAYFFAYLRYHSFQIVFEQINLVAKKFQHWNLTGRSPEDIVVLRARSIERRGGAGCNGIKTSASRVLQLQIEALRSLTLSPYSQCSV